MEIVVDKISEVKTTNTFIYNNTIYTSNDFNYAIIHRAWGGSGSVYPVNTYYYNNIFYFNKANPKFAFGASTNTVFDYNLFYKPLGGSNPTDPHVITTNPNFVNPGNGTKGLNTLAGYKLQSTSPCINAGSTVVGAPNKDFFGNAVPTGATDIGASEFTGTVPVTLTMFKAENIGSAIKLTWNTFTEINNAYFEIQKSNDGNIFEAIATVNSQSINGNSSTPLNYQFIDKKPFEKITYYRLKQIDINGKFSYSNIVSVKTTNKNIGSINVYPNPITGKEISVSIADLQKGNYDLTITNAVGQVVLSKLVTIQNSNETNKIVIANNFTAGSYFIKITGNNTDLVKQIIIK